MWLELDINTTAKQASQGKYNLSLKQKADPCQGNYDKRHPQASVRTPENQWRMACDVIVVSSCARWGLVRQVLMSKLDIFWWGSFDL